MKKLFYFLLIIILSPFVVFAKDIEIKTIEEKENYSDVTVSIDGTSNAIINFTLGDNNTLETVYKVNIQNNTKNNYSLNLSNLNSLENMNVTSNKDKLVPGENNIELTIKRNNLKNEFLCENTDSTDTYLLLNINKIVDNNKENPNTGNSILKLLVISGTLILISVLIYIKTKRKSSFFLTLLVIFIPIIINATEDDNIKININTINNSCDYSICLNTGDLYTIPYTFNNVDYVFNTNDDAAFLQDIFLYSGLNKDNILDFLNDPENGAIAFEKNELKYNLEQVNPDTGELLDVDGHENLGISFLNSYNGEHVYTTVYEDTEDMLEINTHIIKVTLTVVDENPDYSILDAKVTFNKHNNDFIVEVYDNYYKTEGSFVILNEAGYTFNKMDTITVPVINLEKYVNRLMEDAGTITINDTGIYTVDNYEIAEEDIKEHIFSKPVYYNTYVGEVLGSIFEPSEPDAEITDIYIPEIAKVENSENFEDNYLFRIINGTTYKMGPTFVATTPSFLNPSYEFVKMNQVINKKYLVLLNTEYACYAFFNKLPS